MTMRRLLQHLHMVHSVITVTTEHMNYMSLGKWASFNCHTLQIKLSAALLMDQQKDVQDN